MGQLMNGIPGAIAGGIDPQGPQRQLQAKAQAAQTAQHFADARAAHEVAMAHQADLEYQAMPEKLQQEAESRSLDDLVKAKQAGYLPVATIQLDQGTAQNSQNAMTALNSVKDQFGVVPRGLLYIHTGNQMQVLKLQDANAALPTINATRAAMGQKPLDPATFSSLAAADRDSMARDAINFDDPRDTTGGPTTGMVTQNSLNIAQMRLSTVKAQPAFNGQDQLVSQLQASVDHQKAVLDTGAGQAAIRAGQAKGAEAVAAQPGTTAADVANIQATAGPQAAAAGKKAGAEAAAKLPYELQLKQGETDQNPVFAVNPKTGTRELTTAGQARAQGFSNPIKATQADVEKETVLNSQMNDMQLNTSRYRGSLNAMGNLSSTDAKNIQRIITNPDIKGMLGDAASTAGWTLGIGSISQTVAKEAGQAWNELSPDKQDAVIGYLRMKNTGLLAQKVLTGMGRASKEALDIELANMPAPNEGATVGNKKLDAWQENLDQINSRSVKLPWMESPTDVRTRVENQATAARQSAATASAARASGMYKADASSSFMGALKVGQKTYAGGRGQTVTKVYSDGSYDAQ
jgi:hypothetical protein